jgi:uncharacterized protein YggE
MTDESRTLLSVRGHAQLEVAPDEATLVWVVSALEDDKATALRVLASRLAAATEALRELGGVVRDVGEQRHALAWLVGSARTEAEQRWDKVQDRWLPTGKVRASAALTVLVRDFQLLNRVGAALAGHPDAHLRYVDWFVDHDNPGWQQVRATAVGAAVAKARDYAAALGGALVRTEHVADVGLLGDRDGGFEHAPRPPAARAALSAARESDDEQAPSLDPVPQELEASIEARFTATVAPLS